MQDAKVFDQDEGKPTRLKYLLVRLQHPKLEYAVYVKVTNFSISSSAIGYIIYGDKSTMVKPGSMR